MVQSPPQQPANSITIADLKTRVAELGQNLKGKNIDWNVILGDIQENLNANDPRSLDVAVRMLEKVSQGVPRTEPDLARYAIGLYFDAQRYQAQTYPIDRDYNRQ